MMFVCDVMMVDVVECECLFVIDIISEVYVCFCDDRSPRN